MHPLENKKEEFYQEMNYEDCLVWMEMYIVEQDDIEYVLDK
jgi:hypothetical protein